jgi:hypothetical protein
MQIYLPHGNLSINILYDKILKQEIEKRFIMEGHEMKKIIIGILILALVLSTASCRKTEEEKIQEMIEEAVEEALEEAAEEAEEKEDDSDDEKKDKAEKNEDKDKDKDDESADLTIGDYKYSYAGEEIPKDFPADAVPLYESDDAEVVGVISFASEDDITYTLGICTDNKAKDVKKDVEESLEKIYNKKEIQTLAMGDDYYMYVVEAKDWNITISILSGEEEGFETMIAYSVLSN